jgi:hypothetical protein
MEGQVKNGKEENNERKTFDSYPCVVYAGKSQCVSKLEWRKSSSFCLQLAQ